MGRGGGRREGYLPTCLYCKRTQRRVSAGGLGKKEVVWAPILGPRWEIHVGMADFYPTGLSWSSLRAGVGSPLWLVCQTIEGGLGLTDCFWSAGVQW